MPTILSPTSIEKYHQDGFVHVPSIVRPNLLSMMENVLSDWANATIKNWFDDKLIDDLCEYLPFQDRLGILWKKAGFPKYIRSPRRDLVCKEIFDILTYPTLLDITQDLLDTIDISVHGIFNGRPKLPDQKWTLTPWHQDAQYYPDAENSHVLSIWIPLQKVTEANSCLQVAAKSHNKGLFEAYNDPETGFLGLIPEDRNKMDGISIYMEKGDALCFSQCTPHRAMPNHSGSVRWSMDFRYEPTYQGTETGQRQGFVARSSSTLNKETTFNQWINKWSEIPPGNY